MAKYFNEKRVPRKDTSKKPDSEGKPKPTFKERFAALQHLPAFFREIWQTNKWLTISSLAIRIVRSAITLLTLYVAKLIIDEVVLKIASGNNIDNLNKILTLVGIELGLALFSDLLNRAISLSDALLGDLHANRSSVAIMQHAANLDLAQFEDPTFYDQLERARQQTVGRTMLLSQTLAQGQDFITMIFLSIGLAAFNPWLMLVLLLSIIPAFLGETYFNSESYSLVFNWTPQRRELDYYRYMGASSANAKELKLFNLSGFLTERYKILSEEYFKQNRKLSLKRAGWGTLLSAIGTLGYYGAYIFIIFQTANGIITLGSLTFLSGSFRQLRALLEGILGRFNSISQGALYLKDYFGFFAIVPQIASPSKPRPFPKKIQIGFTFENVGFKYPNTERWACRHLNFTLASGEKLALVGENGSGKTTIVKLLTRLYDPSEGRILLDGYDLREYDLVELQKNTGVIFQDYIRLLLTASINIAVGDIAERENAVRIEQSATQSLANMVIEKLPEKYNQILGRHFKGGVDLSGGEWQKIALARAYMREAQLLILDEPTSALDARAEYEVFQRFAELTQGKSAVLISHRFSTVRMANRILVLEKGEMLEIGSHESLMEQNGKYAELFNLQAKGYQ
ncbi:MAG: ABC transporter ATP-binding protein [Verrucomicrobia bacterium]|nr:ABC transporter ATP-binding protein [Cytophagales bacterium]